MRKLLHIQEENLSMGVYMPKELRVISLQVTLKLSKFIQTSQFLHKKRKNNFKSLDLEFESIDLGV